MDWANDNTYLGHNGSDLGRMFKYQSRPSRAIKIVEGNNYEAQVWSLESPEDWTRWLENHLNHTDRGLILVLADRTESDSPHKATYEAMSIEDWLAKASDLPPRNFGIRRATTFAPLGDKSFLGPTNCPSASGGRQQPRGLRYLPFSQQTFEEICEKFQVHGSIVRALARSDVPTFSYDRVVMAEPALVYNCRTPNSWDSDVALSATHYPARGLTFGILYGSTFTTEKNILQRLQTITFEAAHPLLLPGIVAELELVRHTRLVEVSINEVETKIFELNFQSGSARGYRRAEVERRNVAKRTAWLDLTYLRNSITTWSTQLLKMAEHAAELNRDFYKISQDAASFAPDLEDLRPEHERSGMQLDHSTAPFKSKRPSRLPERMASVRRSDSQHSSPTRTRVAIHQSQDVKISRSDEDYIDACPHYEDPKWQFKQMHEVGEKIQHRLAAIRDEYDEKIRDCTMRVDGMAMATQWSHSETAVEIALATNQDSRVMRSISLVTMVFLPGTFFATVFSMTFFNWFDDSGKTRVSSYLWIYVVVTVIFTGVTIGLWYFFVMSRRAGRAKGDDEKLRIE